MSSLPPCLLIFFWRLVRGFGRYVGSYGYHELYVNGEKVSADVLAPSVSELSKRVLVRPYDLTAFLKPGKVCSFAFCSAALCLFAVFAMCSVCQVSHAACCLFRGLPCLPHSSV